MGDDERHDEATKTAAKMLAAAYWRGRLHGIDRPQLVDEMVKAAATSDTEWPAWAASGRALVNMVQLREPPVPGAG